MAEPPPPRPFLKTNFSENQPSLSPDGKWLAYQSNESGRFEIYVRSFPDAGPPHQVSTEGGVVPMWSPDGGLFYRAVSNMLMAVATSANAGQFRSETPRRLFDATRFENAYGVAPDGKRLLMLMRTDVEQSPTVIALVQNFFGELRQRIR